MTGRLIIRSRRFTSPANARCGHMRTLCSPYATSLLSRASSALAVATRTARRQATTTRWSGSARNKSRSAVSVHRRILQAGCDIKVPVSLWLQVGMASRLRGYLNVRTAESSRRHGEDESRNACSETVFHGCCYVLYPGFSLMWILA